MKPNRYTLTIVFKPLPFIERSISYDNSTINQYYLSRLPRQEKIECKTQSEINKWKRIIDDSVISFTVVDNTNNKEIFKYKA